MQQRSWKYGIAVMLLSAMSSVRADQKEEELLAQTEKAMQTVQTLTADMTETMRIGKEEMKTNWKVQLKKPNLARLTLKEPSNISIIKAIISDGKNRWEAVENNR